MKNDKLITLKIKDELDKKIKKGTEINKKNILEAESIKYKMIPNEVTTYDAFGFLEKFKEPYEINK